MAESCFKSPLGYILLRSVAGCITEIQFSEKNITYSGADPVLTQAKKELAAYFNGERRKFEVPTEAKGTDFQQKVWSEVAAVPFGQTVTYGQLARRIDAPGSERAVGSANGRNPLPILIPCHRVIGAGDNLTGYSGGIERKKWLLRHEGALLL